MKPIIVVGSINMDLVAQTERIPLPGETVTGTNFQMHSGGKGANQAVAVARLGHPCTLLGAVGLDSFGTQLLQTLQDYGVDVSHVKTVIGSTGTASITVDAKGENMIIVTPGANHKVTIDYLEQKTDVLQSAGMVLAQLEIPLATIQWLADFCNRFGIPLMLDPAPAISLPENIFKKIQWFTPNETEAAFYTNGCIGETDQLKFFFDKGISNVILKRGAFGSTLAASDGTITRTNAPIVDALDTTAAGDAFNGAFATALIKGDSVETAARFASAAAAISVTRPGAQPSLPTLEEVRIFSFHERS